jgi:hypothetical protein
MCLAGLMSEPLVLAVQLAHGKGLIQVSATSIVNLSRVHRHANYHETLTKQLQKCVKLGRQGKLVAPDRFAGAQNLLGWTCAPFGLQTCMAFISVLSA